MYLFSRIGHLKKIILKGRGFRCGSDEKMMRMWFGLEINVVGLPPLVVLVMSNKLDLRLSSSQCKHINNEFSRNYIGWPRWSNFQPNINHLTLARWEATGRIRFNIIRFVLTGL